ncbi:hypothetical protein ABE151_17450 [Bacillus paralicheniformis]|jgi:hypothetical protein|uniref:hypothetical protein n=1 Tax=Bacillus paralicheniformis TaxID=1648923 RepID=UPI003D263E90
MKFKMITMMVVAIISLGGTYLLSQNFSHEESSLSNDGHFLLAGRVQTSSISNAGL